MRKDYFLVDRGNKYIHKLNDIIIHPLHSIKFPLK